MLLLKQGMRPLQLLKPLNLPKRRMELDKSIFKVKSVHLGNPDDEKFFLSISERSEVESQASRAPDLADMIELIGQ